MHQPEHLGSRQRPVTWMEESPSNSPATWVAGLGVHDDRYRAKALALRLGSIGVLLGAILAVLILAGQDDSFRERHGLSGWWLVGIVPVSMLTTGAIVGALMRHARTLPLAVAIVALGGLPTTLAIAFLRRSVGGPITLSPGTWALVIVMACVLTGLVWGAPLRELHRAAFGARHTTPVSRGAASNLVD